MKAARTALFVSATTAFLVLSTQASNYSKEEQAIWLDRHNYFRTTGLPWSAGNMRRIGWDAALATRAAAAAATCSATTARGVNVFRQSPSGDVSSAIDEAIQEWVVETAVATIQTVAQPGSTGLDVGVDIYNTYSQGVWASTSLVGCAASECADGNLVVCGYSPAGNDGESAWYHHAPQASECPGATVASYGLCIQEGDEANDRIAAIPTGRYSYQVYPAYVSDVQAILITTAREIATGKKIAPRRSTEELRNNRKTEPTTRDSESGSEGYPPSFLRKGGRATNASFEYEFSSSASVRTEGGGTDVPQGKVKAGSDADSTFQNDIESSERRKSSSPALKEQRATTQKDISLSTSEGHSKSAESEVTSFRQMLGMYFLGMGAVTGILLFVHYTTPPKR
ncbi:unnamed protein product [Hyaloperonospora brassicae]|uniref:SCP domain-containing protein n=1 Tax=Hyaloperonospora brassicae TaxID=162125 RepID=A0AAV0TK38_HYABA|nr:unnamed protein product [Hyaloperonospora brassicae]